MKNKNTALLFASHQSRKTKAQKTSFVQLISSAAADARFVSNVENTKNGARNIVVGDVKSASVIYTAHYDTASRSPIPSIIFPKAPILTTLYQFVLGILMLVPSAVAFALSVFALPLLDVSMAISVLAGVVLAAVAFVLCLYFFLSGPAVKNSANSNTSGVATLLEIMANIPDKYRSQVAFVFFDRAGDGLLGSSDFAKKHRHLGKKLFVNFDCVGVGEHFIVAQSRKAAKFSTAIAAAFASSGKIKTEVVSGVNKLPSDHKNFKCAVGVSAFEKTGGPLKLVIKNDDTDTFCNDDNVSYAAEAGIKLVKYIINPDSIGENKVFEKIDISNSVMQESLSTEEEADVPTEAESSVIEEIEEQENFGEAQVDEKAYAFDEDDSDSQNGEGENAASEE